jgi:aminomethyltransferase
MDDATLADETDAWGTLAIEGPAAREIIGELAAVDLDALAPFGHALAAAKTASGEIPCRVIRSSISGLPGAQLLVSRNALAALWSAFRIVVCARGGAPIGYRAINALRLESGIPWFGADFDERHLPHEAGLEKSHISYTKGCYTGQEIVERVRSRGQVHRRLTGLRFSMPAPPLAGPPLTIGGQEVGHVTSAAFSPRVGAAIGLGYLRSGHAAPGTLLDCGQGSATAIELPLEKAKRD